MDNISLIDKYFDNLTEEQRKRYELLGELYAYWNSRINVISRKDQDHLYEKHILHSLGIAKVVKFNKGTIVLDVGTGGGFPGIPLAIMFPEAKFHLVDSISKKIRVVDEIVKDLKLENVTTDNIRVEKTTGKYDFVVSRAVTRMKPFLGWVKGKVKEESSHQISNGILYLKGGDVTSEMREIKYPYEIYELKSYFDEDFFETKMVIQVSLDPSTITKS